MTHRNAVLTPQGRLPAGDACPGRSPHRPCSRRGRHRPRHGCRSGSLVTTKEEPRLLRTAPDQCRDGGPHRALVPRPQVVRPSYQPRARRARDSGVGTHRDPMAGQSRPKPLRRHPNPTGQTNRTSKPIVARFPGHMIHWGAWCFSDWGSFSSLESIG